MIVQQENNFKKKCNNISSNYDQKWAAFYCRSCFKRKKSYRKLRIFKDHTKYYRHALSFHENNTLRKKWQIWEEKTQIWILIILESVPFISIRMILFQAMQHLQTQRVRLRLRGQSVPTIFPNYPNWIA